ncbi:ATPase [Leptobacterium sp. I13]|uniref:ATPase n=1 Tax=Leptobacterium meishanense TaxID=3128904 RepID=UPI0030EB9061
MREKQSINIIKASGERASFSIEKLKKSLLKTGASELQVNEIIDHIITNIREGSTTKQIHREAFRLLKRNKPHYAARYKLKKAIYELGPSGFPFEHYISAIFSHSGYDTNVSEIIKGRCVDHEVDVLALKNRYAELIECKFHSKRGYHCDVKIPLYIQSRYLDIKEAWHPSQYKNSELNKGWVVTNTRFTKNAIDYGTCAGLELLSWDYPDRNGLKDRIDAVGLYPVTTLTLITNVEKKAILAEGIVLCKELYDRHGLLDKIRVSRIRKQKILSELRHLCNLNH